MFHARPHSARDVTSLQVRPFASVSHYANIARFITAERRQEGRNLVNNIEKLLRKNWNFSELLLVISLFRHLN